MVPVAKKALVGTGINIASVATAFPSGMVDIKAKLDEVKLVVESGADEVDMVISRGKFCQFLRFCELLCCAESCVFS